MATCKKCIHSKKCFNNGNTRYYGETIACDNVETLCEWFISTDDVVEVRRGEWKVSYSCGAWHYDCPFCDDGYSTKYKQKNPKNFCSNCGADMRGANDNTKR